MKDFLLSTWPVARAGHQIIESSRAWSADDTSERFLTVGLPRSRLAQRRYRPLKDAPTLFLQFSELSGESAICAFADRYGMLTAGEEILLPKHQMKAGALSGPGEPVALWFDQVMQMELAVDLWGRLRARDTETLQKRIHRNKEGLPVSYIFHSRVFKPKDSKQRGPFSGRSIMNPLTPHPWLTEARRLNNIACGWFVLQHVVNRNLSELSAQLLWEPAKNGGNNLGLYFSPPTLLTALWIQLASAIANNADYRRCAHCGKPFLVGEGRKRSSATYCRPVCRNLAWRKREKAQSEVPSTRLS